MCHTHNSSEIVTQVNLLRKSALARGRQLPPYPSNHSNDLQACLASQHHFYT